MSTADGFVHRLAEKLSALKYPYEFDESLSEEQLNVSFAIHPTAGGKLEAKTAWFSFRDIVVFLEDTVLRLYPEKERGSLRSVNSPKSFLAMLESYVEYVSSSNLAQLVPLMQLPVANKQKILLRQVTAGEGSHPKTAQCVLFHISLLCDSAIHLYTHDEGVEVVAAHHAQWQQDQPRRLVTTVEVVKSKAQQEEEAQMSKLVPFKEEKKVFDLLSPIYAKRGVPMPSSVRPALQETLSFIKAAKKVQSSPSTDNTLAEVDALLDGVPLFNGERTNTSTSGGTTTSSPQVEMEKACKVLRLLFMADLRELQDSINASIGELQNYTATCKVDTKLGRVGR